jgi:hypothetical protein
VINSDLNKNITANIFGKNGDIKDKTIEKYQVFWL